MTRAVEFVLLALGVFAAWKCAIEAARLDGNVPFRIDHEWRQRRYENTFIVSGVVAIAAEVALLHAAYVAVAR